MGSWGTAPASPQAAACCHPGPPGPRGGPWPSSGRLLPPPSPGYSRRRPRRSCWGRGQRLRGQAAARRCRCQRAGAGSRPPLPPSGRRGLSEGGGKPRVCDRSTRFSPVFFFSTPTVPLCCVIVFAWGVTKIKIFEGNVLSGSVNSFTSMLRALSSTTLFKLQSNFSVGFIPPQENPKNPRPLSQHCHRLQVC